MVLTDAPRAVANETRGRVRLGRSRVILYVASGTPSHVSWAKSRSSSCSYLARSWLCGALGLDKGPEGRPRAGRKFSLGSLLSLYRQSRARKQESSPGGKASPNPRERERESFRTYTSFRLLSSFVRVNARQPPPRRVGRDLISPSRAADRPATYTHLGSTELAGVARDARLAGKPADRD